MQGEHDSGLGDAWAALQEGRWRVARDLFSAAARSSATPEALEGLSWSAWWLDDAEAVLSARERAFRLYRDHDDPASAARMAVWLAADHLDFFGAVALASGWLDRACRLLEPLPAGPDHGWFEFHRGYLAFVQGDRAAAEQHAVRTAELGRRFRVADLEMLGLAIHGMTLVSRARVQEGMRCLDEASAIALSEEPTIPISSAWTCCFLVTACTRVLDFERAFEWCDRIAEFAERYGSRYMLGFCRAEYATIHLWRGEWDAAERALEESIQALSIARPPMVAGSLVQLAELRRRQGRVDQAERLLDEAGSSQDAQLCRAALALDRGEPRRATDLAERVLRAIDDDRPLERVAALDLSMRAKIASGALDDAASSVAQLCEITEVVATAGLRAKAALAGGMLAAAAGEHAEAKLLLEDAIDGFDRCGAGYETERARIELIETLLALGRAPDAEREVLTARARLAELGAALDVQRANRLLDRCRAPSDRAALVSRREREVLGLLARGLTNRDIARRLSISEHTVHRHVTNILRKLDVPSRAGAVARGVRIGLIEARQD